LTTIDKMVSELKLPRVDFIKMDIEGTEQNAILGPEKLWRETDHAWRSAFITYRMTR
jgi:FkbM family methyltransferase